MGTVTKRILPSGKTTWRASYFVNGKRHTKQFAKQSDAKEWLVKVKYDISQGTHTPGSRSPTVEAAAALWLRRCRDLRLEQHTVRVYEGHVKHHIVPFIGQKKLSELTKKELREFVDKLRDAGRSTAMIKKVKVSLCGIFSEANERGLIATNPVSRLKLNLPKRDDPRAVIPSKPELQAIMANAHGRWRPIILCAIFCGLRASELRGLRWQDVDFHGGKINVCQRADASHRIGKLKSKAGYRTIPCPPIVINALREWKLQCPRGELDLVFPNKLGRVESHANLVERGLEPALKAAGLEGKYHMHSLRHACASLWIDEGHNPKQIQKLMGHSSITMTFDTYGHLFPDANADQKAAENVQVRLMGS